MLSPLLSFLTKIEVKRNKSVILILILSYIQLLYIPLHAGLYSVLSSLL